MTKLTIVEMLCTCKGIFVFILFSKRIILYKVLEIVFFVFLYDYSIFDSLGKNSGICLGFRIMCLALNACGTLLFLMMSAIKVDLFNDASNITMTKPGKQI